MPIVPRSSRFTTRFTHYMVRAFALNGGRSSQKVSTFSASCPTAPLADSHRGLPTLRRVPTLLLGLPLTSAAALAELRKLLDSLHSNSQRGNASLKEMRREGTNDTKKNTGDDPDEPAVL